MTATHTFESFLSLAQESKWSRKQTRGELFKLNDETLWARRDELMQALGFATTDQAAATQQAAAEESKQQAEAQAQAAREQWKAQQVAREADQAQARLDEAAARLAALEAIADGAVLWCDGCENTVTRVINAYGRQAKYDNGGYRAGLLIETAAGKVEAVFTNTQCPDQFAAECWSVLKAIEFAAERGLKSCTVRNDRIGGFKATAKKNYKGTTYLQVAAKIAREAGLEVTFDQCRSAENLADAVCRRPGKAVR
ncbi:MAG: hypothetical protein M3Q42_11860 [Pseudomonadota bacterium]|nr:hypothetical protein [Pseudomonadota bacterium]